MKSLSGSASQKFTPEEYLKDLKDLTPIRSSGPMGRAGQEGLTGFYYFVYIEGGLKNHKLGKTEKSFAPSIKFRSAVTSVKPYTKADAAINLSAGS